jgi:hypothetical protein
MISNTPIVPQIVHVAVDTMVALNLFVSQGHYLRYVEIKSNRLHMQVNASNDKALVIVLNFMLL